MPICILFHTPFARCSCRVCHPGSAAQNTTLVTWRPGLGQKRRHGLHAWPAPTPWRFPLPPPRPPLPALCAPSCLWHLRRKAKKNRILKPPQPLGLEEVPWASLEGKWVLLAEPGHSGPPGLSRAASWWPCPRVPGSQPLCPATVCPLPALKVSLAASGLASRAYVCAPPPVPFPRPHPGAVPRPGTADGELRITGSHEVKRLQQPRPARPALHPKHSLSPSPCADSLTRGPHPEQDRRRLAQVGPPDVRRKGGTGHLCSPLLESLEPPERRADPGIGAFYGARAATGRASAKLNSGQASRVTVHPVPDWVLCPRQGRGFSLHIWEMGFHLSKLPEDPALVCSRGHI